MAGEDSTNSSKNRARHIRVTPLTLGTWNVNTLMNHNEADRLEWRPALVAREVARYKVQIAALSETQLDDEAQLSKIGISYTLSWIKHNKYECYDIGTGIAMKSNLVNKLSGPTKGLNNCLMTVQLPHSGKWHATLVTVYAE